MSNHSDLELLFSTGRKITPGTQRVRFSRVLNNRRVNQTSPIFVTPAVISAYNHGNLEQICVLCYGRLRTSGPVLYANITVTSYQQMKTRYLF